MRPTGGETGKSNSKFNLQIGLWNEQTELGEAFDSSYKRFGISQLKVWFKQSKLKMSH